MSAVQLTVKMFQTVEPPAKGTLEIRDSECKGLMLRVTARGAKTWSVQKWVDGKPHRITLGTFPELPPDAARRKAMADAELLTIARVPLGAIRASLAVVEQQLAHVG